MVSVKYAATTPGQMLCWWYAIWTHVLAMLLSVTVRHMRRDWWRRENGHDRKQRVMRSGDYLTERDLEMWPWKQADLFSAFVSNTLVYIPAAVRTHVKFNPATSLFSNQIWWWAFQAYFRSCCCVTESEKAQTDGLNTWSSGEIGPPAETWRCGLALLRVEG